MNEQTAAMLREFDRTTQGVDVLLALLGFLDSAALDDVVVSLGCAVGSVPLARRIVSRALYLGLVDLSSDRVLVVHPHHPCANCGRPTRSVNPYCTDGCMIVHKTARTDPEAKS